MSFGDFEEEAHLLMIAGSMLLEFSLAGLRSASVTINAIVQFFRRQENSTPNLLFVNRSGVHHPGESFRHGDTIIDAHAQVKKQYFSSAPGNTDSIKVPKRREADKRFRTFIRI